MGWRVAARTVLLALGLLAGCAREPAAPAAPASGAAPRAPSALERVAALEAASGSFERAEGHWEHGSEHLSFTAYFDGHTLRYLLETTDRPGLAALHNRYYFDNGALFYYVGEVVAASTEGAPGNSAAVVAEHAEFRGATVLNAVRVEHFGEVRLDAAAIAAIRRDAAEFAGVVTGEHNAAPATRSDAVSAPQGSAH